MVSKSRLSTKQRKRLAAALNRPRRSKGDRRRRDAVIDIAAEMRGQNLEAEE